MEATKNNRNETKNQICISRKDLPELLGCGIQTADKIAREAEARVVIGHRVLINVAKIRKFVDEMSE